MIQNLLSFENSSHPEGNLTMESYQLLVCISAPLAIFGFVFYAVVFCFGVFGNVFVICTVCKETKLHTPFNYLVINLAVSDLCVFVFSVPIVVFSECFSWPMGELACRFSRPLFLVFTGVSVCTMITMSYERYRAVVKPLAPKLKRKLAVWIIGLIWILSYPIFGLPRFFVFGLTTEKGILQCDPVGKNFIYRMATKILRIICVLIVPSIVVSWAYIRVMRQFKRDLAVIRDACASQEMARSRAKRNIKTMRLLITIILVFVVCFLPFNMTTSLNAIPSYDQWYYNETVESLSRMLQVAHSCFNPIILCLLSADFRKALKKLCTFDVKGVKGSSKIFVLQEIQQTDNSTPPVLLIQICKRSA
jgi:hypothetical protein